MYHQCLRNCFAVGPLSAFAEIFRIDPAGVGTRILSPTLTPTRTAAEYNLGSNNHPPVPPGHIRLF